MRRGLRRVPRPDDLFRYELGEGFDHLEFVRLGVLVGAPGEFVDKAIERALLAAIESGEPLDVVTQRADQLHAGANVEMRRVAGRLAPGGHA